MSWLDRFRARTWQLHGDLLLTEARAEAAAAEAAEAQERATKAERTTRTLRERQFDGAKRLGRWNDWRTPGTDADMAAAGARSMLRNRSRDLLRNDAHAKKGIEVLVAHGIGAGIKPRPTTQSEPFNELLTRRFAEWAEEEADIAGDQTYYAMQATAFRAMMGDGETLVRLIGAPKSRKLRIPLQLQLLEADHIDSSKDGPLNNSKGHLTQGVEFDAYGARVAYWLFPEHPGSGSIRRPESIRVPAADIIHPYEQLRPGQVRGVSNFSAVIAGLRDVGDYNGAELMKQKIAALFGLIVKTDSASEVGDTLTGKIEDGFGNIVEELYPGLIGYLRQDADVTTLQPPSTQNHESFVRSQLRQVAAGLGITYAQLTGDLAQANYSATRAGMNEFWARMDQLRALTYIPKMCGRVWRRWVDTAYTAGVLTVPVASTAWTVPARPIVNPTEHASARRSALRDGVATLEMEIGKEGNDYREVLRARAREKDLLDALGLILDSSPWDMSGAGQMQPTAESTAEDPAVLGQDPPQRSRELRVVESA